MINKKNFVIIAFLILLNLLAFFWGQYHTLMPVFYISGFVGIALISFWFGNNLESKDLLVLVISATLIAFVDEYAHTSVGSLSYFDQTIPSPLTIFGWSIFLIFIVGLTKLIANSGSLHIADHKKLRIFPVIISLVLIVAVVVLLDYLSIFNWILILVYLFLFAASFYYTSVHPLKWNVLLMIVSLVFGLSMEYIGGLEGLWVFRFQYPISYLILFSWPLRIWAVNAICYALNVDFSKKYEKNKIDLSEELSTQNSIIVVADTHFGLKKEKQNCDPKAFSDFLRWVLSLQQNGIYNLNLGNWSTKKENIKIKAPEKMIFLGDILELWDATKESVDVCCRSIFQTLTKLTCEKIYVLGNHDHELVEIKGEYPLGSSSLKIIEREYSTRKGNKKLIFLHGHQFDKLFTLPSWRIMPLFNKIATVLGNYMWFFVALFVINITLAVSLGISGLADWISLISLGGISIPFLAVRFGRDVWNDLKTTRYNPEEAEDRVKKWWNYILKTEEEEANVIYGHTHSIGFRSMNIDNDKLTLYNLPSWILDQNEKHGISLENVFRHGFLYIDEETIEFIGWDTRKKRPFFIPKILIQERRESDFSFFETNQYYQELLEIGWPEELINKWFKFNFPETYLA